MIDRKLVWIIDAGRPAYGGFTAFIGPGKDESRDIRACKSVGGLQREREKLVVGVGEAMHRCSGPDREADDRS